MRLFDKLFKKKFPREDSNCALPTGQAVIIELKGDGLPQATYDQYGLDDLEEELLTVLDHSSAGYLDGHEITQHGASLYLYGPDAESLFQTVEPLLRSHPLCKKAFVTVRRGETGSPERVLQI